LAFGLERIDWARPWFAGWRELGSFTSELVDEKGSVCSALNAVSEFAKGAQGSGGAVEFVSQGELPSDIAYEAFIYSHKRVPTRDNLHDFFNGLCWLRFPKTKSRLNFLQAQEITSQGVGATRGPLRDALTLFDENVLLLQSSDALWQALQDRDWIKLFVELRDEWQSAHVVTFGHALLEKLVTPYKSITAHVYRIASDVDAQDDWLASDLQPNFLATKPFLPLPVLGIPGWWPENEDASFYTDIQVFRVS
jgi:hypothetical protein